MNVRNMVTENYSLNNVLLWLIYKVKIYTNMNALGENALNIFSGIKIFVRKVTNRKVTPK